jgi:hypothetical protein
MKAQEKVTDLQDLMRAKVSCSATNCASAQTPLSLNLSSRDPSKDSSKSEENKLGEAIDVIECKAFVDCWLAFSKDK